MYLQTIERAILGLPSLEVGAKIVSASFIRSTAFSVRRSGSPGPHPTHVNFINRNTINALFKFEDLDVDFPAFLACDEISIQARIVEQNIIKTK
jgi:hypothetical protein